MLIGGFRLWCLLTTFPLHFQPPTPLEKAEASAKIPQQKQKADKSLGCPPPPSHTTSKPVGKAPDLWKNMQEHGFGGETGEK